MSLFQSPRTNAQDDSFKRSLGAMGDLYASAIGTSVLQLKEIPPRPSEFDGKLCVFGLQADEGMVCDVLSRFGQVVKCEFRGGQPSRGDVQHTQRVSRRQAGGGRRVCRVHDCRRRGCGDQRCGRPALRRDGYVVQ